MISYQQCEILGSWRILELGVDIWFLWLDMSCNSVVEWHTFRRRACRTGPFCSDFPGGQILDISDIMWWGL